MMQNLFIYIILLLLDLKAVFMLLISAYWSRPLCWLYHDIVFYDNVLLLHIMGSNIGKCNNLNKK